MADGASNRLHARHQPLIFFFGDAVGRVGNAFQDAAIDDADLAAAGADRMNASRICNSLVMPGGARQDRGEELMGNRQVIGIEPVMAHQQPSREPFAQAVLPFASTSWPT